MSTGTVQGNRHTAAPRHNGRAASPIGQDRPRPPMSRAQPSSSAAANGPTEPNTPLALPRTVTPAQIARMLEMPLLDPAASPVAVAQAAALGEVMKVANLLCHPNFVRTAADALMGSTTGIAAPVVLDCAHTPVLTPAAAAEQAEQLVSDGAILIGLVWHASRPSTLTLQSAIRATVEAIAPAGATVRVALDTTAMSPQQITTTVHAAIDAGAHSLSAGAGCTGRARLIDALRIKRAAAGHPVTWAANLRNLDEVLVARSEGIDVVRGAADLIIRQALQRAKDGLIPLPWPGRDYLSWNSQLSAAQFAQDS